jgi:hypothetical protein
MSRILYCIAISCIMGGAAACQVLDEKEAVRQLESIESREAFLARLSPQDKDIERLLLRILESHRGQMEAPFQLRSLRVGLTDAFGVLRTKEAIPWLITTITYWRHGDLNDVSRWRYPSATLEYEFPAVQALVRIGPPALDALIQTYHREQLSLETRRAIVFTVSRIKDPGAKHFLKNVQHDINQLQRFVNEGLAEPASADDVKK